MELIIKPEKEIEEYIKKGVTCFLLPLKDYSVEYSTYYELDDIKSIREKYKDIDIFVSMNKNYMNEDIDNIKKILKELDKLSLKGIFFYDAALLKIKNDLDLFVIKMKRKEEEAFFKGNGKHKPLGIIHQAQVGVTSENKGAISFDDVIDLYYSLKIPYRNNAVWLMSEEAYSELKKFKTHSGFYLWDKVTGKPNLFLGKPVYTTTQLGI